VKKLISIAAVVLVVGAGAVSAAPRAPLLRIPATEPLTVRGLYFHPGERVTVTVLLHQQVSVNAPVHRMKASPTGAFLTRFTAVVVGDCDLYVVRAVGNMGSRAAYKQPRPVCGAELQPVDR
jgi:hypothetical protein